MLGHQRLKAGKLLGLTQPCFTKHPLDRLDGIHRVGGNHQNGYTLLLTSRGRFAQVHSGDVKIYQALDVLPRAYVVHQVRFLNDDTQTIALLSAPDFDPSKVAVLHGDPQQAANNVASETADQASARSQVTIMSYQPHQVVLQAHMEQPGYVVLSDTWYPGWQASLDGQPVPIERANLAFRAVRVPQGSHTIAMSFHPASFVWGVRISLCTLAAIALAVLFYAWRAFHGASLARSQTSGLDDHPTLGYNAIVKQDTEGET